MHEFPLQCYADYMVNPALLTHTHKTIITHILSYKHTITYPSITTHTLYTITLTYY